MLLRTVFLQVLLQSPGPRSKGIPTVKHIDYDVRRVNDFVEFFPNTSRKALVKNGVSSCVIKLNKVVPVDIIVFFLVIAVKSILSILHEFRQGI
jgi:hypothetical protein